MSMNDAGFFPPNYFAKPFFDVDQVTQPHPRVGHFAGGHFSHKHFAGRYFAPGEYVPPVNVTVYPRARNAKKSTGFDTGH